MSNAVEIYTTNKQQTNKPFPCYVSLKHYFSKIAFRYQ